MGGLLAGWSYALLRIGEKAGKPFVLVRATPPDWPFPQVVQLAPGEFDSMALKASNRAVDIIDTKERLDQQRKAADDDAKQRARDRGR